MNTDNIMLKIQGKPVYKSQILDRDIMPIKWLALFDAAPGFKIPVPCDAKEADGFIVSHSFYNTLERESKKCQK